MNVSTAQLKRTANWEGFRSKAYKDGTTGGSQNYSIGYGHQIRPNEQHLLTASITQAKGLELLNSDMQTVVSYVNKNSKKILTQGQFDALADFGFNCGVGALGKVISTLNASGHASALAHLQQYIYWTPTPGNKVVHPDLKRRRAENTDTWNGGTNKIKAAVAIIAILAFMYYYVQNNGKIPFLS